MSRKDRDRLKVLHEAEKKILTQKQAGVQLKRNPRALRLQTTVQNSGGRSTFSRACAEGRGRCRGQEAKSVRN
jgi:hypothetical protein